MIFDNYNDFHFYYHLKNIGLSDGDHDERHLIYQQISFIFLLDFQKEIPHFDDITDSTLSPLLRVLNLELDILLDFNIDVYIHFL